MGRVSDKGVDIAEAAIRFAEPEQGRSPDLTELTERLSHIDASRDDWKRCAMYLAAQFWAIKRASGAEQAQDAVFAMSQISTSADWYKDKWLQ